MLFPVVEVTRSLSNLIKYPFVNMQGKEKKVISYEESDPFVPLKKSNIEVVQVDGDDGSGDEKKTVRSKSARQAAEDDVIARKKAEAEQQAEWVLSEAREQAERIRVQAEQEADSIRQAAREEGVRIGREEGLSAAEDEIGRIRTELEASRQSLEQEKNNIISELEVHYVDILCDLVRKLTGVLLRDKKDVLLHLIRSSFADIKPSDHYTLRVSAEDLTLVEGHLDDIVMQLDAGIQVDVKEEKGLSKNECIIETDTQMIDCGFHTQLDNLITTLHMLVQ